MNVVYKSLVLTIACVASIVLLLFLAAPEKKSQDVNAVSPAQTTAPTITVMPAAESKFYFDIIGHSAAEFRALLDRARTIYNETPTPDRDALEIVLVLHGPDIDFFEQKNYAKYQNIVELAAQLDAFGVFDFKMCAASAADLGLAESDVPAFIEFVPYGPEEIARLETSGFVQI